MERESEIARRRAREAELHEGRAAEMTRGGAAGAVGVSPLQGTKVVIQNLQTSVTQEDVEELFGDIGALKKAKVGKTTIFKFMTFIILNMNILDDSTWPR